MVLAINRCQGVLLAGVVLFTLAMTVDAPFPDDVALQHGPTLACVVALAWSARRAPLTDFAFSATIAFLALHALGARYVYSNVPYDEWTQRLFGRSLSDVFELRRNHYDRLVHFAFGLAIAWPAREFVLRWTRSTRSAACWLAFAVIVALAALYELGEWCVALTFAPERAERYLGQQGDPWDAQRDMALAVVGAALSMAFAAFAWAPGRGAARAQDGTTSR